MDGKKQNYELMGDLLAKENNKDNDDENSVIKKVYQTDSQLVALVKTAEESNYYLVLFAKAKPVQVKKDEAKG